MVALQRHVAELGKLLQLGDRIQAHFVQANRCDFIQVYINGLWYARCKKIKEFCIPIGIIYVPLGMGIKLRHVGKGNDDSQLLCKAAVYLV